MQLLQMDSIELIAYVEKQMEENPVLELIDPPTTNSSEITEKMEWLESLDSHTSFTSSSMEGDEQDPIDKCCSFVDTEESLFQFINSQLEALTVSNEVKAVAVYLAQGLDKHGYMVEDCGEVAQELHLPLSLIEDGLKLLQSLEISNQRKNAIDLIIHNKKEISDQEEILDSIKFLILAFNTAELNGFAT